MKKNINTYEELLTSLALSGDSAAFHSLVEPYLRSYYVKMVSEGMQHGEVSEKLCEKAVSLYKTFLVSGKNAFDFISDSEFEKGTEHSGETDFLQSDVVNTGEQQFSRELMHCLQQFRRRYKGKFRNAGKRSFKFAFSKQVWLFTALIIVVIAGIFAYLFLFPSGVFDGLFIKKPNIGIDGSQAKKDSASVKSGDMSMARDSVKKGSLKDTVPKIDTLPKPKPKPRRTVTENPQPTGSSEILNAFDASPVAKPGSNKEQQPQTQTSPGTGTSSSQTGGSEFGTRSSASPAVPQPSTQSQDSSWGY